MAESRRKPIPKGYRMSEISATALARKGYRISEVSQSELGKKDEELSQNKERPDKLPVEQEARGAEPGAAKPPNQVAEPVANVPAFNEFPPADERSNYPVPFVPMKINQRGIEDRRPSYIFVGAVMLALTLSLYILVFSPSGKKPARVYEYPDTEGSGGGTPEFIVQHKASPTTTTTNVTDPDYESFTEEEITEPTMADTDMPAQKVLKRGNRSAASDVNRGSLHVEDSES